MSKKITEKKFPNCPIFIEPYFKDKYQDDLIRESDDNWIQINCADGEHITVNIFFEDLKLNYS